jgi:hypothetical protein
MTIPKSDNWIFTKGTTVWVILLALLLVVEFIVIIVVGNPNGTFKNVNDYTYQSDIQSSVSVGVNGINVSSDSNPTPTPTDATYSGAIGTILNLIPITVVICILVGVFGALSKE